RCADAFEQGEPVRIAHKALNDWLVWAALEIAVRAALELAPISKIMFSTDAHLIPETFYLGARCGREVIAEVLSEAVADGDLSPAEADAAALDILHRNAARLYFGQERIGPA
ncbi:MAG: hypothetical protein ACK4JD_10535, partial [Thermoflexales bacterium]